MKKKDIENKGIKKRLEINKKKIQKRNFKISKLSEKEK